MKLSIYKKKLKELYIAKVIVTLDNIIHERYSICRKYINKTEEMQYRFTTYKEAQDCLDVLADDNNWKFIGENKVLPYITIGGTYDEIA